MIETEFGDLPRFIKEREILKKEDTERMKKRIMAVVLAAALCITMSATALAASPSTSGSSSSSSSSSSKKSSSGSSAVTEATKGDVNTDSVNVAVVAADGTVSRVNLTNYSKQVNDTIVSVAANFAASGNPGGAVSSVLTTPASNLFMATINVLGGNIKMVNAGGFSVKSTAPSLDGRTIASVGKVRGVTQYAFVILTAVNADGSVEIIEGVVDPVSLEVMGAFNGTPKTVTVSVIMAK